MVDRNIGSATYLTKAFRAWDKLRKALDACADMLEEMEIEQIGAPYEQTTIQGGE